MPVYQVHVRMVEDALFKTMEHHSLVNAVMDSPDQDVKTVNYFFLQILLMKKQTNN